MSYTVTSKIVPIIQKIRQTSHLLLTTCIKYNSPLIKVVEWSFSSIDSEGPVCSRSEDEVPHVYSLGDDWHNSVTPSSRLPISPLRALLQANICQCKLPLSQLLTAHSFLC